MRLSNYNFLIEKKKRNAVGNIEVRIDIICLLIQAIHGTIRKTVTTIKVTTTIKNNSDGQQMGEWFKNCGISSKWNSIHQ